MRPYTCVELVVLLSCHYSDGPDSAAPSYAAAIKMWRDCDCIEPGGPGRYKTTARGAKFVDMLSNTPLPEQRWADPRGPQL